MGEVIAFPKNRIYRHPDGSFAFSAVNDFLTEDETDYYDDMWPSVDGLIEHLEEYKKHFEIEDEKDWAILMNDLSMVLFGYVGEVTGIFTRDEARELMLGLLRNEGKS